MQISKEYLNAVTCKFYILLWIKLAKFWHITRISSTNRRKVINSQKWSSFFGPPCTFRKISNNKSHRKTYLAGDTLSSYIVDSSSPSMPKWSFAFCCTHHVHSNNGGTEIASTGKRKYGKCKYETGKFAGMENASTENPSTSSQGWKTQVWKT